MYERSIKALRLSDVSLEDKRAICKRLLSSPNLWPPPGPPILDHALFVLTTTSAKKVPSLLGNYWGFVRDIIPTVDLSPSHYGLLCDAASTHIHEGPLHLVNEVFRCLSDACGLSQCWPISIESSARLLKIAIRRVAEENVLRNSKDVTEVCNRLVTSHALIQSRHGDLLTVVGVFLDYLLQAFSRSAHGLQLHGVKLLMMPIVSSSAKSRVSVVRAFTDRCDVVTKNMTFVTKAFIDAVSLKTEILDGTSVNNEHRSAMNEEHTSEARQLIQILLAIIQYCLDEMNRTESLHNGTLLEGLSLLFSNLHTLKFSITLSTLRASWRGFALSEGERLVQRIILSLCEFLPSSRMEASAALKALAAIVGKVSLFGTVRQNIFGVITDDNVRTLGEPQYWELLLRSCVKASYREGLIPKLFESLASAAVAGGEHVMNLFLSQRLLGDLAEAVRLLPRTHSVECVNGLGRFISGTYGAPLILSTVVVESTAITELADVVASSIRLLDQIQQSHCTDRSLVGFELYLLGSLTIATSRVMSQDISTMVVIASRSLRHKESYSSSQCSLTSVLDILQSYPKTVDGFELYCILRILCIFSLTLLTQKESEALVIEFARTASKFYDALLKPAVKQSTIPFLGRSTRDEAANHINALRTVLLRHKHCAVINFMSVDNRGSGDFDQEMTDTEPICVEHPVFAIDDISFGPPAFANKVSSILHELSATLSSDTALSDKKAGLLTEALDTTFRKVRPCIEPGSVVIADSATCSRVTKMLLLVICAKSAFKNVSSSRGGHLVRHVSTWILNNLQNLLVPLLNCMEKVDEMLSRSHCLSALVFLCVQVVEDRLAGIEALSALIRGIVRLIAVDDVTLCGVGMCLLHIIARRSAEGLKLICDILTVPVGSSSMRSQTISVLTKGIRHRWKRASSLSLKDASNMWRLSDVVRLIRYESIEKDNLHAACVQRGLDITLSESIPSNSSMCILCGSNAQAVYAIAHHAHSTHDSIEGNIPANAAEHYLCTRCQLQRVNSWKHLRVLRQVRNMGVGQSKIREEAELVGENISLELLKGMVADSAVETSDRAGDVSTKGLNATEVLDELAISHDVSQTHIAAALQQNRGLYKGK